MKLFGAIPLVISILVGFLLCLLTLGLFWQRRSPAEGRLPGTGDGLLLGLLALSAFAMGIFVTYLLFGLLL